VDDKRRWAARQAMRTGRRLRKTQESREMGSAAAHEQDETKDYVVDLKRRDGWRGSP